MIFTKEAPFKRKVKVLLGYKPFQPSAKRRVQSKPNYVSRSLVSLHLFCPFLASAREISRVFIRKISPWLFLSPIGLSLFPPHSLSLHFSASLKNVFSWLENVEILSEEAALQLLPTSLKFFPIFGKKIPSTLTFTRILLTILLTPYTEENTRNSDIEFFEQEKIRNLTWLMKDYITVLNKKK